MQAPSEIANLLARVVALVEILVHVDIAVDRKTLHVDEGDVDARDLPLSRPRLRQ